jgi:hypothetical protein
MYTDLIKAHLVVMYTIFVSWFISLDSSSNQVCMSFFLKGNVLYPSRMIKFYEWIFNRPRQALRMKVMSATALTWMSYSKHAVVSRLHQIQTAWFDYRRTIKIKIDVVILQRNHQLLRSWFVLQRKRKAKPLRRLKHWVSKRKLIQTGFDGYQRGEDE